MKILPPVSTLFSLILLWGCSSSPFVAVPRDPEVCLVASSAPSTSKGGLNEVDLLLLYYGLTPWPAEDRPDHSAKQLTALEIKNVLEGLGFASFAFAGVLDGSDITSLRYHLDLGRPLLVLLKSPRNDIFWNFLVGYTDQPPLLIMQGPDRKLRGLPRDLFSSWWNAADRLTILAVPDTTLPMEN